MLMGSTSRVPASVGIKVGTSPLLGDRSELWPSIWDESWSAVCFDFNINKELVWLDRTQFVDLFDRKSVNGAIELATYVQWSRLVAWPGADDIDVNGDKIGFVEFNWDSIKRTQIAFRSTWDNMSWQKVSLIQRRIRVIGQGQIAQKHYCGLTEKQQGFVIVCARSNDENICSNLSNKLI